jgi:hypothetical protein
MAEKFDPVKDGQRHIDEEPGRDDDQPREKSKDKAQPDDEFRRAKWAGTIQKSLGGQK